MYFQYIIRYRQKQGFSQSYVKISLLPTSKPYENVRPSQISHIVETRRLKTDRFYSIPPVSSLKSQSFSSILKIFLELHSKSNNQPPVPDPTPNQIHTILPPSSAPLCRAARPAFGGLPAAAEAASAVPKASVPPAGENGSPEGLCPSGARCIGAGSGAAPRDCTPKQHKKRGKPLSAASRALSKYRHRPIPAPADPRPPRENERLKPHSALAFPPFHALWSGLSRYP